MKILLFFTSYSHRSVDFAHLCFKMLFRFYFDAFFPRHMPPNHRENSTKQNIVCVRNNIEMLCKIEKAERERQREKNR